MYIAYGYKLDQSADQQSILALEELMNGEVAAFDHCSMFIDGISGFYGWDY